VALPLALLLSRVYQNLAQEVFYQYRSTAEEVVKQVNQRLADILQGEELRPFDEYSFLKVTANPLFKNSAIVASPLSELPPQSAVPGVIGYFQINPDGSLNSPVLPDLDEAELSANAERLGCARRPRPYAGAGAPGRALWHLPPGAATNQLGGPAQRFCLGVSHELTTPQIVYEGAKRGGA